MFVTMYEHGSLYEPAEGGYFYETKEVAWKEKIKHGKAKKRISSLYNQMKLEVPQYGRGWEVWISNDSTSCGMRGPHIGDGFSYHIESKRKVGRMESGRRMYQ